MKTTYFKNILLALALLPYFVLATDGPVKGKYTKEKTIKKEFIVNTDALLKIKNSYGNLNITSWNEDRVRIEVHITTNGNNEKKVQERLNDITVDFDASASEVEAITNLSKQSGNWYNRWNNKNQVNMQINYTVKVPVKNSVNLNNDYGNISLDRIDGHAKINCDYGRLTIGELRGRNNEINFDYTSKSTFGFINSGQINADYSGFTIEKAGDLKINADYTTIAIDSMKDLNYSCDYGAMDVKQVGSISGIGDYISTNFGKVTGDVSISADYGGVKIKELTETAGDVTIKTDYSSIKIGYHPNYAFNVEISTKYAGVSGTDALELSVSMEKSTSKYYKGFHKQENSGNTMYLSSQYGGISLIKN